MIPPEIRSAISMFYDGEPLGVNLMLGKNADGSPNPSAYFGADNPDELSVQDKVDVIKKSLLGFIQNNVDQVDELGDEEYERLRGEVIGCIMAYARLDYFFPSNFS